MPSTDSVRATEGAVHVVGGGLAGSEAAWQLGSRGIPVVLH
ncbi:MAG: FAD-dependent oxidoreductase, partial [Myxococcota bacterium]|nr:FAD-dependent oxidoreductase [Myxococcota bacterium]